MGAGTESSSIFKYVQQLNENIVEDDLLNQENNQEQQQQQPQQELPQLEDNYDDFFNSSASLQHSIYLDNLPSNHDNTNSNSINENSNVNNSAINYISTDNNEEEVGNENENTIVSLGNNESQSRLVAPVIKDSQLIEKLIVDGSQTLNLIMDDKIPSQPIEVDVESLETTIKLSSSKSFASDFVHPHRKDVPRRRSLALKSSSETINNSYSSSGNDSYVKRGAIKKKRSKIGSFLTSLSPIKKKRQQKRTSSVDQNSMPTTGSWLISSKINSMDDGKKYHPQFEQFVPQLNVHDNNNNSATENEDDEDEFFLAISSSGLRTGSCPEFYWYPEIPYTNSGIEFGPDRSVPMSR